MVGGLLTFALDTDVILKTSKLSTFTGARRSMSGARAGASNVRTGGSCLMPLAFCSIAKRSVQSCKKLKKVPRFVSGITVIDGGDSSACRMALRVRGCGGVSMLRFSGPKIVSSRARPEGTLFKACGLPRSCVFRGSATRSIEATVSECVDRR